MNMIAAPADVVYAELDSPLGPILAAATTRGVVRLAFGPADDYVLDELATEVSPRIEEASAPLEHIQRELDEYFELTRTRFSLDLDWSLIHGFGRKVLRATARIPYGSVSTYGEIAAKARSPRAARAAGNALGANPIPIVIPCHRVLRAGGALGGYGSGLDAKRYLLDLESGG